MNRMKQQLIEKIHNKVEGIDDVHKEQHKILVLLPSKIERTQKEEIKKFCKTLEIPLLELKGNKDFVQREELRKGYLDHEPEAMMLIGDPHKISGNYYRTMYGRHFTDNVLQDPELSGRFTTPVGRVYGDTLTIIDHILMKTGDSNIACVILPKNSIDNELAIEGINKLGLDTTIVHEYNNKDITDFIDAEVIFQFSNSSNKYDIIHGELDGLKTEKVSIMSSTDLLDIEFQNYPLIFSQACLIGNFGTFANYALRARACFLGSSSPTYSFDNVQFDNWETHLSSDGWKIGLLDLMDEKNNIGQIKIEVENRFMESVDKGAMEVAQKFMEGKTHTIPADMYSRLMVIFQYQYFGNPLRYSPVGIDPNFDL